MTPPPNPATAGLASSALVLRSQKERVLEGYCHEGGGGGQGGKKRKKDAQIKDKFESSFNPSQVILLGEGKLMICLI